MTTIHTLIKDVQQAVAEEASYLRESRYPDDMLHEIADGWVPVYHAELVEVLGSDLTLAYPEEPDLLGDAPSVWNVLSVSIYERLLAAATEEWDRIQEEEEYERLLAAATEERDRIQEEEEEEDE